MPVKALRVQIIKPINGVSWAEAGEILRDLRYTASKMANYVIQKCYEWENFRRAYREEHGIYPAPRDHKDRTYIYPQMRCVFPDVPTQILNQIRQQAEKIWKANRGDVLAMRKSIPSFKMDFPIYVHNEGYSLAKTENSYIVGVGLAAKGAARTRFEFVVKAGEKSKRAILDRLINGTYKKGALQIVSDPKGKWYCIIPYYYEPQAHKELNPKKIMGVDMGVVNAVYWAFNSCLKRGYIDGGEIEAFRKRVQERRKSIQRQGKYCGTGRIGHGRKRRLQPIEVLSKREENFRSTINHRYAKTIVETAYREGCGVIQMEDLTGINTKSTFLRGWPYFDLQKKIIQKAEDIGILVVLVKSRHTSQRCSECGYIHKSNRPNQSTFICQSCGFGGLYHCTSCGRLQKDPGSCTRCGEEVALQKVHADYNAARNIATAGIDQLIEDELKKAV